MIHKPGSICGDIVCTQPVRDQLIAEKFFLDSYYIKGKGNTGLKGISFMPKAKQKKWVANFQGNRKSFQTCKEALFWYYKNKDMRLHEDKAGNSKSGGRENTENQQKS